MKTGKTYPNTLHGQYESAVQRPFIFICYDRRRDLQNWDFDNEILHRDLPCSDINTVYQ